MISQSSTIIICIVVHILTQSFMIMIMSDDVQSCSSEPSTQQLMQTALQKQKDWLLLKKNHDIDETEKVQVFIQYRFFNI